MKRLQVEQVLRHRGEPALQLHEGPFPLRVFPEPLLQRIDGEAQLAHEVVAALVGEGGDGFQALLVVRERGVDVRGDDLLQVDDGLVDALARLVEERLVLHAKEGQGQGAHEQVAGHDVEVVVRKGELLVAGTRRAAGDDLLQRLFLGEDGFDPVLVVLDVFGVPAPALPRWASSSPLVPFRAVLREQLPGVLKGELPLAVPGEHPRDLFLPRGAGDLLHPRDGAARPASPSRS